jgi:hypothetical protein
MRAEVFAVIPLGGFALFLGIDTFLAEMNRFALMKCNLIAVVLQFVMTVTVFCEDKEANVPDVVTAGIIAYGKGAADSAVDAWIRGSAIEHDPKQRDALVDGLKNIQRVYGGWIGWELIRVVKFSPSCWRVYGVVKYERGPAYVLFDCYKTSDWILNDFEVNVAADKLLPAGLLAGQTVP